METEVRVEVQVRQGRRPEVRAEVLLPELVLLDGHSIPELGTEVIVESVRPERRPEDMMHPNRWQDQWGRPELVGLS